VSSADPDRLGDASAHLVEDSDLMQAVRLAINRLPAKQKAAITLVYLDGLSQTEAAKKSGCEHATFRRRLAHGRAQLRKLLPHETYC
jgi:RNA polymerase sigma factor (sigma-70 family)